MAASIPPVSASQASIAAKVRELGAMSDDVAYCRVVCADQAGFLAFLQDSSLSRRRFGYRTADLLAIQSYCAAGEQFPGDFLLYLFNSAQRECVYGLLPGITDADMDTFFPAPPRLASSAADVLRDLQTPLALRAAISGRPQGAGGGGARRGRRGGRGRRRRSKSDEPARDRSRGGRRAPSRAPSRGGKR